MEINKLFVLLNLQRTKVDRQHYLMRQMSSTNYSNYQLNCWIYLIKYKKTENWCTFFFLLTEIMIEPRTPLKDFVSVYSIMTHMPWLSYKHNICMYTYVLGMSRIRFFGRILDIPATGRPDIRLVWPNILQK